MITPTFARGVRFRRTADGKGVLLIPEGVVELNESAAAIIELIDGQRTGDTIARDLSVKCARSEADINDIKDDVDAILQRLVARSWLVDLTT
jgi:pyrroloquinoline quinone biosynthesis protein D